MPSEMRLGATMQPAGAMFLWRRELSADPETPARRAHLLMVFLCTVALNYELYVGGGVEPLLLGDLRIRFSDFVFSLAFFNFAGALASLFAGLTDRMGRANLVVAGLGAVGVLTVAVIPNVHDQSGYGLAYGAVGFWRASFWSSRRRLSAIFRRRSGAPPRSVSRRPACLPAVSW